VDDRILFVVFSREQRNRDSTVNPDRHEPDQAGGFDLGVRRVGDDERSADSGYVHPHDERPTFVRTGPRKDGGEVLWQRLARMFRHQCPVITFGLWIVVWLLLGAVNWVVMAVTLAIAVGVQFHETHG
jgi:hypothetical protein